MPQSLHLISSITLCVCVCVDIELFLQKNKSFLLVVPGHLKENISLLKNIFKLTWKSSYPSIY